MAMITADDASAVMVFIRRDNFHCCVSRFNTDLVLESYSEAPQGNQPDKEVRKKIS